MVTVLSEKQQEFNGEVYWLCGKYFQRFGKRLHRAVYEFHHGPIPKGGAVHHVDGNRHNNNIENLVLMGKGSHQSHHMQEPKRRADAKRAIRCAIKAAAEWHKSEEGREWHKEQYLKTKDRLRKISEFTCAMCGATYETEDSGRNKFCSKKCSSAWRRKSGIDHADKICATCGKAFQANKYQQIKYCSSECRAASKWGQSRGGNPATYGRKRVLPDGP